MFFFLFKCKINLGGDILSTFNISSDNIHFGKCNLIEEILIGEDKFVKFSGINFFYYKMKENLFDF